MTVSMESGLEDRNNRNRSRVDLCGDQGLNGVRPRRPEQSGTAMQEPTPCQPVSMESGLEDRNNRISGELAGMRKEVSMESGLEDRNN